ncbi:MAG: hypothetical protein WAZ18_06025 [Alphaproteobacteria bacterium]
MNSTKRKVSALMAVMALMGGTAVAQDVSVTTPPADAPLAMAPTEAEAEQQFLQAQEQFKAMAAGTVISNTGPYEVAVFSDPTKQFHAGSDDIKNVALGNIHVTIDVEDTSLRDVVNEIVSQAAEHSGAWTVKWRLKPENSSIPDEKVNLTAESNFDDFVARLTERVRNLTGVGLYITAFEGSRVILVTDSFY